MKVFFCNLRIYIVQIIIVLSGCISLYSQAPPFLGGLGMELAFYPLLVGVVFWLIGCIFFSEKVYIPKAKSFYLLLLFLIWLIFTGIANIDAITESIFKGVSGSSRFIIQYCTMLFYFLSALYIYNSIKTVIENNNILDIWESAVYFSALIFGAYSFFEIASLLGNQNLREIVNFIDSMFRSDEVVGDVFAYVRIRSLTAEASYFGMYCGVAIPWLIVHAVRTQGSGIKKIFNFAFVLYYIVLLIFSLSRTAYFMIAIELVAMFFLYRKYLIASGKKFIMYGSVMLVVLAISVTYFISMSDVVDVDIMSVFLSFVSGNEGVHDLSNIARTGSQWAGVYIFLDNPFFGVGFGEYPYYYVEYVPAWAWISQEVQLWGSDIVGTIMTPSHGLYTRILGETGFIGLSIWLIFFCYLFIEVGNVVKNYRDIRCRCCFVTLIALCLFGFNLDAFRVFYYWIFMAFIWALDSHVTLD